jgi:GT2 family glycosyltransferase/acetyltransferase-like isoleucine patch superfamily enzyme
MRIAPPKKRAEILQGDSQNSIKIGNNCEIHSDVNFGSEPYLIEIGDYVRIASGVSFVTHDGGMWVLRNNGMLKDADYFGRIIIGNNVHIGLNAIIMPGVVIGDNVIIGAGSIVTRNIQDNCIAAGVPARVIRDLDDYYNKYIDKVDYTKHLNAKDKKKYLLEKYSSNVKVGIIILNYNTPFTSIDCIKSIMDTYQGEYHIYLVDNNSQDSSLEIFFETYKLSDKVTIIAEKQNRGYAAGNNVGLIKAMIDGCQYLMISNSDIVFLKKSIQSLVDFLVCKIDAGLVVPSTFNKSLKNTTIIRKSATKLWHLIVQTTFLKHSLKKLRKRVMVNHENIKDPTKVDVVSGCCMLLKKELIDEIGLLDENTFLYSEEYILERKISNTKYKTYFVPYAKVIHNHGVSTNCNLNFAYIKSVESILYYAKEYLKLSMPKRIILYLLKSIGFIKMNLFKKHFIHVIKQYIKETIPTLS